MASAAAVDEGTRSFGVVDLSMVTQRAPEALRREVRAWAAARGLKKLSDAGMQRALGGAEAASVVVTRAPGGGAAKQDAGDCAQAVAMAGEAEVQALATLTFDDEREPLKTVYSLQVACEHAAGHAAEARAAAFRLAHAGVAAAIGAARNAVGSLRCRPRTRTASAQTSTSTAPRRRRCEHRRADRRQRPAQRARRDQLSRRRRHAAHAEVRARASSTSRSRRPASRRPSARSPSSKYRCAWFSRWLDRRQDRAAQVESAVTRLRGSDPAPTRRRWPAWPSWRASTCWSRLRSTPAPSSCGGSTPNAAI